MATEDIKTPYQVVFDAFLSKIQEDDWSEYMDEEAYTADWISILHAAMAQFKFPRFNTKLDDEKKEFNDELTDQEVEILAQLMKQEWLDRAIHDWQEIKLLYDERDFSPANMLDKLIKALDFTATKVYKLQKSYSRSILSADGNKRVFDYTIFGGKSNGTR